MLLFILPGTADLTGFARGQGIKLEGGQEQQLPAHCSHRRVPHPQCQILQSSQQKLNLPALELLLKISAQAKVYSQRCILFFFPLLSSLKRAWHLSACRHLIGLDWRRPSGDGLCADKKLLQLIQNLMICRSRTVRIILLSSSAWFGRGGAVWRISLQALMSTCLMNSPTVRTPGTPASPALDLFFHL